MGQVYFGDVGQFCIGVNTYVASDSEGLQVIDVSSPSQANIVASLAVPGSASKLAIQENYLFVAAREGGLKVIDLGDFWDSNI